jgi:hypothetical protein
MKIYKSPLSIGGLLIFILGAYLTIVMLQGAYPTFFAFIFLGLGLLMIGADYFIRKSALSIKGKFIIQSLCALLPLFTGYLYFSGKL